MKEAFYGLASRLEKALRAGETLLCNLSAERSDFVRFNKALVRQAGTVQQSYLSLKLVRAGRQAAGTVSLAGTAQDEDSATRLLGQVRDALDALPEDPWLLINETPQSSDHVRRGKLARAEAVVEQVVGRSKGLDFVGFYAGGTLYRGFANSLGQRNWHEVDSFNFDWSVYLKGDRAVKTSYAGFDWDSHVFSEKLATARGQLEFLARERRTIEPGEYRAYLAPAAMNEVLGMLSWGGFSARARQTRQSPLLLMQEGRALSRKVTVTENTAEGIAKRFDSDGFPRPPAVPLITQGALADPLVSPRSAKEYGLPANGAGPSESPASLDMAAGGLEEAKALEALERGLYISNLWYLNYSDRPAGRITGMTRFATFRVEHGRIAGPVTPMRFDDSIYRMLGDNLLDLTRTREMLLDPSTYGERSIASARVPGALLGGLRLTL